MDLNYLLRRRQEERVRAKAAASEAARRAHEGLAAEFDEEIRRQTGGRMAVRPPVAAARFLERSTKEAPAG